MNNENRRTRDRESLSESTILQNYYRHSSRKKNCWNVNNYDGFTVISSCFFVLTLAVTFSLVIQIYFGSSEVTPHGAVATDNQICSEIGLHMMQEGGNAVDATIAALLCLSVTHPHQVGPGGGGVMLIHDHKLNKSQLFDFMPAVPARHQNFTASTDINEGENIGIPGFLKGLEVIHHAYGQLPWKKLFEPAISLARYGFIVSEQLANELSKSYVLNFPDSFKSTYFPKGIKASKGQNITRKKFSELLEGVSLQGSDDFYLLKYGVEVVGAFKIAGSKIIVNDFHNYEVKKQKVFHRKIFNKTILTVGPPFGGLKVVAGLSLMEDLFINDKTTANKLYEAFLKGLLLGSNHKNTILNSSIENKIFEEIFEDLNLDAENIGAKQSVPDSPSSQVSAIDTFDLYVAAIVGLGSNFGSGVMTDHGIILNNQLSSDSVSDVDVSPRPFTPYTPLILYDTNNVCGDRVVLSSGSSSAMFQVVSQIVFKNLDMSVAISEPRIILGKEPNTLLLYDIDSELEKLPSDVRESLKRQNFTLGHLYIPLCVNGVAKFKDTLVSHSDTRGGGIAARHQKVLGSPKAIS